MKKITIIAFTLVLMATVAKGQKEYKNRFEFTEGVEKIGLWGGTTRFETNEIYGGLTYSVNQRNANIAEIGIQGSLLENEFCDSKSVELSGGYGLALVHGSRIAIRAKVNPFLGYESQVSKIGMKEIKVFLVGGVVGLEMEILIRNDNGIYLSGNQRVDYLANHDEWRGRYYFTFGFRVKL